MREVTLDLGQAAEPGTNFVRVYVLGEDGDPVATIEISEDIEGSAGDLNVYVSRYRDVGIETNVLRAREAYPEVLERAREAALS